MGITHDLSPSMQKQAWASEVVQHADRLLLSFVSRSNCGLTCGC
jgi:hypothetical protein